MKAMKAFLLASLFFLSGSPLALDKLRSELPAVTEFPVYNHVAKSFVHIGTPRNAVISEAAGNYGLSSITPRRTESGRNKDPTRVKKPKSKGKSKDKKKPRPSRKKTQGNNSGIKGSGKSKNRQKANGKNSKT